MEGKFIEKAAHSLQLLIYISTLTNSHKWVINKQKGVYLCAGWLRSPLNLGFIWEPPHLYNRQGEADI